MENLNKKSLTKHFLNKHLSKELKSQSYAEISKLNEKWTDELFPPNDSSIFSGLTEFSNFIPPDMSPVNKNYSKSKSLKPETKKKRNKTYIWKRLSEVFKPGEINIVKEPPEIKDDPDIMTEDVVQGDLGDCYFLSALSALAEYPKRIKMYFPYPEFNKSGSFVVQVYIHGCPIEIVVDDYFPFIQNEDLVKIAFVGINERSKNIWPMLLEKAWAKVNLNFEGIIAGNSGEAFEFLTPAPIDVYYHEGHLNCLFADLKRADEKDYIICSDITQSEATNVNYLLKMGLITNHAYTIIDVLEISDNKGDKIKLLKIRNPWGSNEWTGDWGDKSSKWTPEIKKRLNYNEEDDGTFFMSYEDFCKFFTTTHVCKIHTDYNFFSSSFPFEKNTPFNIATVEIDTNCSGYFIVNQKNTRIYKNAKGLDDFENKFCSVIVFKKVKNKYFYIGATCGKQNRLYIDCKDMTKGMYYIAVSFPMPADNYIVYYEHYEKKPSSIYEDFLTYRIGVYCPLENLKINELQNIEEIQLLRKFFLKEVIYELAIKNENIYYFQDEGEKDSWRSISFEKEAGAYGYIYYENNSDGFIYEQLTLTQLSNLNFIPNLSKGEFTNAQSENANIDGDEKIAGNLKSRIDLESTLKIINIPHMDEIREDNPVEVLIQVAPHSKCSILIEKYDEYSEIEVTSKIAFSYPMYKLLGKNKFQNKETRIKYNGNFVDIYENVIEHSSCVLFKYSNKTIDLKLSCHVIFTQLQNLKLTLKPDDLISKNLKIEDNNTIKISKSSDSVTNEFNIKDPSKEITLSLEPGETKVFGLTASDIFEQISYSSQMVYNITNLMPIDK